MGVLKYAFFRRTIFINGIIDNIGTKNAKRRLPPHDFIIVKATAPFHSNTQRSGHKAEGAAL